VLAIFTPLDEVTSFEVSFDLSVNTDTIFQLSTGFDDGGAQFPLAIRFDSLEDVNAFSQIEEFGERHGRDSPSKKRFAQMRDDGHRGATKDAIGWTANGHQKRVFMDTKMDTKPATD